MSKAFVVFNALLFLPNGLEALVRSNSGRLEERHIMNSTQPHRERQMKECLVWANDLKKNGVQGRQLVQSVKATCPPDPHTIEDRKMRLACESIGGVAEPYANDPNWKPQELCNDLVDHMNRAFNLLLFRIIGHRLNVSNGSSSPSQQYSRKHMDCDYFCNAQCSNGTETPMCKNCMYNCHSEKSCESAQDQEKCLVNRACGIHAFNTHVARGTTVDEHQPWLFCAKRGTDKHCKSCLKCVQDNCYYTPGAYHTQCSSPQSECCRQKCFSKYLFLSNNSIFT